MDEQGNINEIDIIKSMDEAMVNSYDLIVGNTSIDELLLGEDRKPFFFAHNVELEPTHNDIKSIRDYFEKMEDYERCMELSQILNE